MLRTSLALAAVLACPLALAEAGFLRPGQWEMTLDIERDGKPVGKDITSRRCVTPETLAKEEMLTFQPFEAGCTGDHQRSGKDIAWTYECSGPPPMKGSGKLTFAKDKYWGESESYADLKGGQSLRMTRTRTKFEAKRVGDCAGSLLAPDRKAPVEKSRPADPNETRAVVSELGDRIAYVGQRQVR